MCLQTACISSETDNVSSAFEIAVTGKITVYGSVEPKEAFVVDSTCKELEGAEPRD